MSACNRAFIDMPISGKVGHRRAKISCIETAEEAASNVRPCQAAMVRICLVTKSELQLPHVKVTDTQTQNNILKSTLHLECAEQALSGSI